MFKKLLKYDFRALFKIWWIFAVSIVCISYLFGIVMKLYFDNYENTALLISFILLAAVTVIGISAFSLCPLIISAIRFYKNLFSDEGYLTFTLPVKLKHIINSKILSTSILTTSSILVLILCIFIVLICQPENVVAEMFAFFKDIAEAFGKSPLWMTLITVEILLIALLYSAFSMILIFVCITLASIITKKARVILSVGIYYGVNSVLSFIGQFIILFAVPSVGIYLEDLSDEKILPALCLLGLVAFIFFATISLLLYILQYYMLDKKLNLA